MSKQFFVYFLFCIYSTVFAMEKDDARSLAIAKNTLFFFCDNAPTTAQQKYNRPEQINAVIQSNPALLKCINKKLQTPLICLARTNQQDIIKELMNKGLIDKDMLKKRDSSGHSFFSLVACYGEHNFFYELLSLYSLKQIHHECKQFPHHIYNAPDDKYNYNYKKNPLFRACLNLDIPCIVPLVRKGYSLHTHNATDCTPYELLEAIDHLQGSFIMREVCSIDYAFNTECNKHMLIESIPTSHEEPLSKDIALIIQKKYIELSLDIPIQKLFWQKELHYIRKFNGWNSLSSKELWKRLLLLPQKSKTALNKNLLQEKIATINRLTSLPLGH